jgi:hypothetical protein
MVSPWCPLCLVQGVEGWSALLRTRAEVFPYLRKQLVAFAATHGERVLTTPGNPVRWDGKSTHAVVRGLSAAAWCVCIGSVLAGV